MPNIKEQILLTALRLFAQDGYEAVSVNKIASEIGMTKGALYKHYENKRDIFNSIVKRMYQIDYERAKEYEVPEELFEKMPQAYCTTSIDKLADFSKAQFIFWVEDEFASNFRKMLTLEQYRDPEIADLYQSCLVSGPVSYVADLFQEMIKQGICNSMDPQLLALEFYAPLYLLISISDGAADKKELVDLLAKHLDKFIKTNMADQS